MNTMKTLYNVTLATLACVSMVGCNDLDTKPMSDFVTSQQKSDVLEQDPSMLSASVQGITAMSYLFDNYYQAGGNARHNDFGYPSVMLFLDCRGADMVSESIGYNWYSESVTYEDCNQTGQELTGMAWATMYNQIFSANQVLKVVDQESDEDLTKYYVAQAKAFRANCYFVLAQLYAQTYAGHQNDACVPVITEANADEAAADGIERNTVEEVYTQIMSDLNDAVDLLTGNSIVRSDKRYVNLATVYGLRSRVEMVMNKWADAATDAKNAIDLSGAVPYSIADLSVPTFISCSESSWMWGIVVNNMDDVVTTGICNWPSMLGSLNYGYASVGAWRYINTSLYASIPDTDVRKGWWLDENLESPLLYNYDAICPGASDYAKEAIGAPYVHVKFAPYNNELGTNTNANDVPLMRVEEMYLNYAEALAMSGSVPEGLAQLNSFVQLYRDPSYKATATTAEAVQDAVYQQRRIEFWGEGRSYFDLLRLKKGIDRRNSGFAPAATFNIPAEAASMILLVPEDEMQANPKIGANNPTPTVPTPVASDESN